MFLHPMVLEERGLGEFLWRRGFRRYSTGGSCILFRVNLSFQGYLGDGLNSTPITCRCRLPDFTVVGIWIWVEDAELLLVLKSWNGVR